MVDAVERLVSEYGLLLCVECGKCVAVCPMGEIFDDFTYETSPRGVIAQALLGPETRSVETWSSVETHVGVWFCLTCDLCTNLCPAGVRFRDFVEAVRRLIIEAGITEHGSFCRTCGAYLWPQHTVEYLKQTLGAEAEELLTLCPRCRQYDFGERVKALTPGNRRVCPQGRQMGENQSRGC
jgi:heterodisulfide reductase subunit C